MSVECSRGSVTCVRRFTPERIPRRDGDRLHCELSDGEGSMSTMEEIYQGLIQQMSPAERLARAHVLLAWVRDLYARQIRAEKGDLSDEQLRWEVALRIYGSDRRVRPLIEEQIAHVSSASVLPCPAQNLADSR